jgi:Sulfotransferase family
MNQLLFVCGFPGGGTDLTKLILNTHPEIYINGEMPFLKNIKKYGYDSNTIFSNNEEISDFKKVLRKLDEYKNIENIDYNFSEVIRQKRHIDMIEVLRICFSSLNKRIWGNKTPQNTENILTLSNIFPNSMFLIIVRDVRDVCLSWNKKWGRDILSCGNRWAQRMKFGREVSNILPNERVFFIRYEDILSDLEVSCRSICDFLDVQYDSKMLDFHNYANSIIEGKINYGKPLIAENKEKWKKELNLDIVKRIEEISFSTMQLYNYEIYYASEERKISKLELLYGKIKDLYAYILIGNRSSKHNTMKRRMSKLWFEIKKII